MVSNVVQLKICTDFKKDFTLSSRFGRKKITDGGSSCYFFHPKSTYFYDNGQHLMLHYLKKGAL